MNKKFWQAAAIRAVRTFAQSMVSMIAVGAAISEVSWLRALSVSAVAALLSILTSIATGLPEAAQEETRKPPDEEPSITVLAYEDYDENGDPVPCADCDLTRFTEDMRGEDDADR